MTEARHTVPDDLLHSTWSALKSVRRPNSPMARLESWQRPLVAGIKGQLRDTVKRFGAEWLPLEIIILAREAVLIGRN